MDNTAEREKHPSRFRVPRRIWYYARAVEEGGDRVLCCYCDVPLRLRVNAPATPAQASPAVLDHVIPVIDFEETPDNSPDNVVAACWQCNTAKGDRTPAEWAADDGPADAERRAAAETARQPSARALDVVREIYEVENDGGAWSTPEPPPPYGRGPARRPRR